MKKLPEKEKFIIATVLAIALILRFYFQTKWLEDWDSVQFALGLHNFSLANHQPHPPGYILYILMGRVLNSFLHNDIYSLNIISITLGTLSALPLFFITRKFTDFKSALASCIIFLIVPVQWMLSEVALSNIPGMFFTILTAYFLLNADKSKSSLYLGAFLAGLSIGVRFAEFSIVTSLLLLTLYFKKKTPEVLLSILIFFLALALWLIPLITTTGINIFISLYQTQINYIINHDSSVHISILTRIPQIWQLFTSSYTYFFIPILLIITYHCLVQKNKLFDIKNMFPVVWLLSYLIPLVFFYNLEVPRHLLPLLPPLIILCSLALKGLTKINFTYSAIAILIVPIFLVSLRRVIIQKNAIPPTIAPVSYVRNQFCPCDTTLVTTFTYRQFQYYAPEFTNYYGASKASEITSKIIIIDYEKLRDDLAGLPGYRLMDKKDFDGDKKIFPRINKTSLYIFERI